MKVVLLLVILFFVANASGQKKIKTPIVLSAKDTVRVDDVIVLKKGTEPDGRFKFVRTVTSSFPAPAKCEGYEQEVYYFKYIDEEYKAFTVGFVISLEDALKNGEIEIKTRAKTIAGRSVAEVVDVQEVAKVDVVLSEEVYSGDILRELRTAKWGISLDELKNIYGESIKILPTPKKYGSDSYSGCYLPKVNIGKELFSVNFVMKNSENKLSRIVIKPLKEITQQNSFTTFNMICDSIVKIYGIPSVFKQDTSSALYFLQKEWLADSVYIHCFVIPGGLAISVEEIEDNPDFRKSKWGESKLQVRKNEKSVLDAEYEDMLLYKGNIANLNATIGYVFVEDMLVRTKYVIKEEHTNKNDYIIDYQKLKRLLSEKYGKPVADNVIWRNKLYQNNEEHYGLAVSAGHLVYTCRWKTKTTEILIALMGGNFEISLQVEYTSLRFKNVENEKKKTDALDDL